MKSHAPTFEGILISFTEYCDLPTLFDDFLTMSLCLLSQDTQAKKTSQATRELYLRTLLKYDKTPFEFLSIFNTLLDEMKERIFIREGSDVIGTFYEAHVRDQGNTKYFLSEDACETIARKEAHGEQSRKRAPFLDTSCGSGRMILATAKYQGREHQYFGIDSEEICVKMATLNLFFNGIYNAEIVWAEALALEGFKRSYFTSLEPYGIKRDDRKEDSLLWRLIEYTL